MRLIDADEYRKRIDHYPPKIRDVAKKELRYVKTVQQERKKGKWIDFSMSIKGVPTEACGECGEWSLGMGKNFCPNCGADMRGES